MVEGPTLCGKRSYSQIVRNVKHMIGEGLDSQG
jgi:hypothetical protein